MIWQLKRISGIFVFILFFASLVSAGDASPNTTKDLDKYFAALARNREFSGNVLIAEHGRVIYEKSFGYADRETKRLNAATTSFPTASIAKTITSTAILQLKEKGKLALTDPVVKYFPEFPYPSITIRHLLSHTSGLPGYGTLLDAQRKANPGKVFTNADFLPDIKGTKIPLEFQPGDKYMYNNTNYLVLALIIEKVSGVSYLNYVRENIFEPAGMHDTSLVLSFPDYQILKEQTDYAGAYWYPHYWYSDELMEPNKSIPFYAEYWSAFNFKGFSDYKTTTHDFLKYDKALYDGKLLSETSLQEAFTPVKLNDGTVNSSGYGLGWEIDEKNPYGTIVNHSGGAMGFSCILLRNITKRQTIIMYSNILPDNYTFVFVKDVLKLVNGQPVELPRKSIAREFGKTLVADGFDAAMKTLQKLKGDTSNFVLDEDQFNSLGYDLMGDDNSMHLREQHKYPEAVEVLKLNVEQFPTSSNAYDSYAEALQKNGQKEEAIKMYKEALRIDPKNEHALRTLAELQKPAAGEKQ
jgi:CubicO group peptidase (beta-lactamase class C family)